MSFSPFDSYWCVEECFETFDMFNIIILKKFVGNTLKNVIKYTNVGNVVGNNS